MYQKLQVSDKDITDALAILHRYAQVTDPSVMEFLTVDAPQDAVHLLKVMERERSPDLTEAKDLISSMKGGCSAGIRVANVSPEGDVYPCQFAQTSEFFIGSIRTKPFSCLWNDPANQVLSLFRNKLTNLSGQCKTCNHLQICGGGCRVRAYFKAGNINEDDPFCSFRNELAGRND
jgi:radical SAM protein with 4Fe4S-binding SPASM domain